MGSSTLRRSAAAVLLGVLALGGGLLPAAVADGTAPSPAATATATPSPSPTPSGTATPLPEPTPAGTDPVPDPSPSPSPSSEPKPSPAPKATRTPGTSDHTRGHGPDTSAAVVPVDIADFDCDSLTTTVTLVNTSTSFAADFTTTVSHWSHALGFEDTWRSVVTLEPGDTTTLTPDLDEGYNTVRVDSTIGPVTEKSGACGVFVVDPRATIEPLDCDGLTVRITLDNSRSTEAVFYHPSRSATGGIDHRTYQTTVDVAAGEVQTVELPLLDAAVNSISVEASGPVFVFPASAEGTCGFIRHATVDSLACGSLTATVTLDNTAVPVGTTYTVQVGDGVQDRFETTRTLVAGAIESLEVPLGDDTSNVVRVLGAQDWVLAERTTTCGTVVTDPSASIGAFDCDALVVPVTLDNTRSTTSVAFMVQRTVAGDDHPDQTPRYVLTAGEVRVVLVPLMDATVSTMLVSVGDENGAELDSVTGPLCGLLALGPVDCETLTFPVTLVNDDADHSLTRRFLVSSTRHRTDRAAYHQEVSVAPTKHRTLTVPVEELRGGDLRIEELGTIDGAVLHEEPVDVPCVAGSGSGVDSESPVSTVSGALAATGPTDLAQLVLAGLAMVAVGGALLLGPKVRRRAQ